MPVELDDPDLVRRADVQPWLDRDVYWLNLSEATREHSAPVVALNLEALSHNARDLTRRAGGLPIRVASKSVRVRAVLDAVLALPGYRGVLAYSLAEAIWLADTIEDVVVAYPTVDPAAMRALGRDERIAQRVTIMVDSVEQLDFVDRTLPPSKRASIRVCLDFDTSWQSSLGHIGVLRSPLHAPNQLRLLAEIVLSRPGFTLVGMMAYEAQIAGVGDGNDRKPVHSALIRWVQRRSAAELAERRRDAVAAVHEVADLEFVNGGGTGSIERTAAEASVTEVAAGSGLFGPHLFDHYRSFTPAPAVAFALDVVRRPGRHTVTLLGGGWIASGVSGGDRSPLPVWPEGLSFAPREGAGEVQTPVIGEAAQALRLGDRVWLRHTKAGEIAEHTNEFVPVSGGVALDPVPSYRGEGKCFL
jgi:D-serine deaminase-like pyridoxal phosphate-dependent protein